ncbi:hypothetical protein K469DRAFT_544707 [Zopfia rhizophila CBS 207.26]|uniref:Developmental regulatory protein wetA n=1 Tax=Zopfia rhizophila CBS 207.26 TaxID=1314779 RepID=A0A6A6ETL6_9PEZI|nr:hypothetical protein K469DRAFT_544707 [Zopfia rhizophila CBS 207.26]
MRPTSDKELEVSDLDDLFDRYVETDLLQQFSDNTVDPSSSDDLAHLFEHPSSNGIDLFETLPMPNWDVGSENAWHKAPQNIKQSPASPTMPTNSSSIYPESRGKASLSDLELFSVDDHFELGKSEPRIAFSAPSTPKPKLAPPSKKATSNSDRSTCFRVSNGIHKSTKKSSISPEMMRPSHYRASLELWKGKIEASADSFNLQLPPNALPNALPNSPPPSAKLVQDENANRFYPRDQPYTIDRSPLNTAEDCKTGMTQHSNYQLTPLSSPAIDLNPRNSMGHPFQFSNDDTVTAYVPSHISNGALSALQTPPPTHRLPIASLGPDTPASLNFSFQTSPEFETPTKTQGWWNNTSTPQPSHHASQPRTQNVSFSTASVAGLGITCDTTSFSSFSDIGNGVVVNGTTNGLSASSFDPSGKSSQSSTPSTRPASVGFVNFTPDDSRKILTGVAPSGSSKTKARREKEAAEKRRKLSQAAVKAVMEAGGDLGKLEKEGLLCLTAEE